MKQPAVYIMASSFDGVLYVGVTSNLAGRVWKHKTGYYEGFTKRYHVKRLVYYELHATMQEAIHREKRIKSRNRSYRVRLIEGMNQFWKDLYPLLLPDAER